MTMTNQEIARTFASCADILAIQGESRRRIRAYERAAEAIRSLDRSAADVWREGTLTDIPGIGKILADKIEEMLTTGKLSFLERLQTEVPAGVIEMLTIPDVGPRKAARFWEELQVTTIGELEEAARAGRVQQLSGMGSRTEAKLIEAIDSFRRWQGRTRLGTAWFAAHEILAVLDETPGVIKAAVVGSVRRMRDTVGNIDLLVATEAPAGVIASFRGQEQVAEVLIAGETETTIRTGDGLDVHLRVIDPGRWGSGLQHFTGSQAHNARLHKLASERGYSLSVDGFTQQNGTATLCAAEKDVYHHLRMSWIPPELREDQGEIDAALADALPDLLQRGDLRGDLQMHTTGSDGHQTLAEMAEAAGTLGFEYILITDHSHSLGVAGGQSAEDLRRQGEQIRSLNEHRGDLRILAGSEVEIRADGSLDYPDEVLSELDLVVASLHTGMRSGRERNTARMLAAMRNPHVDIIAHPTNRLIGRREGTDLDMEAILRTAARTGTAIEINAHPDRLDLPDRWVRRAIELGIKLAINSDAHDVRDFDYLFLGVGVARRGWATSNDVINTWELGKLLSWARSRGS